MYSQIVGNRGGFRCPLYTGDFNRSMQHLSSNNRAEDAVDEAKTEDLLQRRAEELDVGPLAGRRLTA